MIENERLEYKKSLGELKEALISIAAMLNKHGGGELWFGLKNDGTPVGLDVTDKTLRDLSQAIAAHIEPKVYPTISAELVGGKHCVRVAFVGEDAPYYALYRVDVPEISTAAMREAIINAFCHRDYRDPDEVRVAIFKDRVEIRNPGTLFGGLTVEDLRKGGNISKRRNPLIADLLHRIHMVEGWGRGMPLILEQEPEVRFREVAQVFISDFIRHAAEEEGTTTINDETSTITNTIASTIPLSDMKQALIELIRRQPSITLHELAERLNVTRGGVRYHVDNLKKKKAIRRIGTKHGHWKIIE